MKVLDSDNRFQLLVESLPVGVVIIQGNTVIYSNTCAEQLLELDSNGKLPTPQDFVHPNYISQYENLLEALKTGKDPGFVELKIVQRASKRITDVEMNGSVREDGAVQFMIHDISSRKQLAREQLRVQIAEEQNLELQREIIERGKVEKQLRQTQRYIRSIIDSSMDMIIATDVNYRINEFNKAAEKCFGYARGEVIGKHLSVLFSDDVEMDKVIEHITEHGGMTSEIINKRKDNTFFISFLSASVLRDTDGKVVGAMGVSRDITADKKAEDELRLSEERHRAIYDQAYIGIGRIAKMGRFLMVNERLSDMLGYAPEELYRKTFYELAVQDEVEDSLHDWDKLLSGEISNFSREQRYIRKDGDVMITNVTVSLVRDTDDSPNYFVAVFEDITERKKYEKELQRSLTEKEVLLKEVHHRVKNNMQVISSILNLQSSYIDDETALAMLRESQDRIKSMSFVHESLYQSDTLSEVNFTEYIQNIVRNLYHSYAPAGSDIELDFELQEVLLNLDTSIPCGLIVNELISNAFKYAFPEGKSGVVQVKLFKMEDGRLKLIIKDNGIGLPENFDIDAAESLGLQLVTTLATQISGKLKTETEHGTTFTIEFKEQG